MVPDIPRPSLSVGPGQRPSGVARVDQLPVALLVPATGPASTSAVQVEMPNGGTGYLSDNDNQADLVLLWDIGAPLQFCGLSGAPRA